MQQRAMRISPEIRLTFTLMTGGADVGLVACWPFAETIGSNVRKLTQLLSQIASFTIDSQVRLDWLDANASRSCIDAPLYRAYATGAPLCANVGCATNQPSWRALPRCSSVAVCAAASERVERRLDRDATAVTALCRVRAEWRLHAAAYSRRRYSRHARHTHDMDRH